MDLLHCTHNFILCKVTQDHRRTGPFGLGGGGGGGGGGGEPVAQKITQCLYD